MTEPTREESHKYSKSVWGAVKAAEQIKLNYLQDGRVHVDRSAQVIQEHFQEFINLVECACVDLTFNNPEPALEHLKEALSKLNKP